MAAFAVVAILLVAIPIGGAGIWALDVTASAPSIDTLEPVSDGESSEIFDADGKSLGFVQSDILREPTGLGHIPEQLQQATIAIEDSSFYEHDGVDYSAIARAAVENLEAGEVRQGASTITQQLVRNLYIEDPEDTIERKLTEAEMAREYEQAHSKEQILRTYLNTAAYGTNNGRTAVGVKAAARVFFNKDISDLGLRESALLAGLPQAPTDYNPFLDESAAIDRRNQVLAAMAREGDIDEPKASALSDKGLGLDRGYRYEKRDDQYFFDYVQDELIDRYGQRTVREGGLKVYTTLRPELQDAAEQAIVDHPVTSAASALVSTNADTGEILAMASSVQYDSSQFNLAAQGERQPGSSFKPFVLTTAVDQGVDPDTTYYSAPSTITLQPDPAGEAWTVSGGAGGSINLRNATTNSVNTVFAQLSVDVGPDNFVQMAHRMGITSELDGYYAEALGGTTSCCTVLEMSNAYATLASGGVHHDPTAIDRVVLPNGEVDKPEDPAGKRVISDGVAYEVADVMKGPLDSGTAAGFDLPCPASGKTGTTEQQSDAWFVGYTPHVSTAVWTGNPDQRLPLPGYGGTLSAPIWQQFMQTAAAEPCDDFPKPEDPASLSASSGGSSSVSTDDSTDDGDSKASTSTSTSTSTSMPTTPAPEDATDTDKDGDGFDDSVYAPGVDPNAGGGGKEK